MSFGPIGGVIGSAAGSPLSQTKGAAAERAKQDAATQERTTEADLKSERASGVGQTEGDQRSSDRDADGRRLWERPPEGEEQAASEESSAEEGPAEEGKSPPSDDTGGRLDLIG